MALFKRSPASERGMNKKTDSPGLRPSDHSSIRLPWGGIRRRRLVVAVVVVAAIYVFIHNIPTDVAPVGQRYNSLYGSMASGHSKAQLSLFDRHKPAGHQAGQSQNYEGPVRFTALAATLRTFASAYVGNVVLFALLHASSASQVLPLACRMKQHNLNSIHIALMGDFQGTPEDLMAVNGVTAEDCPVTWHDARPDRVEESSRQRILASIQQGYSYLHKGLAPSVVMVDVVNGGDLLSMEALETATSKIRIPLFKIPEKALQTMPWLTMLEGPSINVLSRLEVEVVVQAYSDSAGSLFKLLRSLRNANYDGLPIPRLTIELPSHADSFVMSFLSRFQWPPRALPGAGQMTVRRRVNTTQITPAEASLRTIEAFYPRNPQLSHVLLLSPDTELGANYMHYLAFSLLQFKYAQRSTPHNDRLFGISLELPPKSINGVDLFIDPATTLSSPFILSQSPNAKAGLFFGDRWMDFHNFLSKRLAADPHLQRAVSPDKTLVGDDQPQWARQALEMMQARGLYMLYPAFARDGKSPIAVVHPELHLLPDEFAMTDEFHLDTEQLDKQPWVPDDAVLDGAAAPHQHLFESHRPNNDITLPRALLGDPASPNEDVVSPLSVMSLRSVHGKPVEWYDIDDVASKHADQFSLKVGGCASLESRDMTKFGTVDFWFCEPK